MKLVKGFGLEYLGLWVISILKASLSIRLKRAHVSKNKTQDIDGTIETYKVETNGIAEAEEWLEFMNECLDINTNSFPKNWKRPKYMK